MNAGYTIDFFAERIERKARLMGFLDPNPRGWQKRVADHIGLKRSTVANWINPQGPQHLPGEDSWKALAPFLDMSVKDMTRAYLCIKAKMRYDIDLTESPALVVQGEEVTPDELKVLKYLREGQPLLAIQEISATPYHFKRPEAPSAKVRDIKPRSKPTESQGQQGNIAADSKPDNESERAAEREAEYLEARKSPRRKPKPEESTES